ncbi:GNAT family N-acetyltransferase [Chloroflexota bacterium]
MRNSIISKDSLVLVALENEHVVVYSISGITKRPPIFQSNTLGFIYDMAVNSSYRRKSIGKRMLDQILTWFNSRNVDRVEVSVVTGNTIANSFWRKHGFQDYEHILYLKNSS